MNVFRTRSLVALHMVTAEILIDLLAQKRADLNVGSYDAMNWMLKEFVLKIWFRSQLRQTNYYLMNS